MMACLTGGGFPRPVVDHRTLDAEDATVVVDDDQEEWLDRVGVIGDETILSSKSVSRVCSSTPLRGGTSQRSPPTVPLFPIAAAAIGI